MSQKVKFLYVVFFISVVSSCITFVLSFGRKQPKDIDVQLMQECTRCRDKEAMNWQDAARKRLDQIEALEKQLESYKAEADAFRDRVQRCEAGRVPVGEEHPFKVDDAGLHINMEAVTGASFEDAIFKDVTTDWGVCSGVGPWCIAPYNKLTRKGRKAYDAEVRAKAKEVYDDVVETLKVKDGTH